jgi:hypothetical protein
MRLKITEQTPRLTELGIEKGKEYEVLEIVQDTYMIAVPMKRKAKFKQVLVNEDEGELVYE